MSTNATIRNLKTRNPNLPIYRAADAALKNAVCAFDMVTYSDSMTLTDITGNGRDAVFNTAPTVNGEGTAFTSAWYADFSADTADYHDNMTAYILLKHTAPAGSYVLLSQRTNAANTGIEIFTPSAAALWTPKARWGFPNNDTSAEGLSPHIGTAVGVWSLVLLKANEGAAQISQLEKGTSTVTRTYTNGQIAAKPWRLGAGYNTADAPYLTFRNATIAHCGLIDGVIDLAQENALLAYMREVAAARGGTLP